MSSTTSTVSPFLRAASWVIDEITFGLPYAALNTFLLHVTDPVMQKVGGGLIATVYFTLLWSWLGGGRTVGMRLLGLRVVTKDGSPLSLPRALLRALALTLSVAAAGIGLLWALFDSRKRTWADLIAGTEVVPARRQSVAMATAALLAMSLTVSSSARAAEGEVAQVVEPAPRWHVSVATEPLDFALGGYYAWAAVRTPALPNWSFAVGSFAFNLPDVYFQSSNPGFHLRAMPSGGIDADYSFNKAGEGLYVGAALAWFRERYTHDSAPGEHADLDGLFTHLNVGYRWIPSKDVRFYVEPWGFLGTYVTRNRGPVVIGTNTFQELPVAFNIALRIGYDFEL